MTEPPSELLPNLSTDITQQAYLYNVTEKLGLVPHTIEKEESPEQVTQSVEIPSISTAVTPPTEPLLLNTPYTEDTPRTDSNTSEVSDEVNSLTVLNPEKVNNIIGSTKKIYDLSAITKPILPTTHKSNSSNSKMACYRCGRTNHFVGKCYAKTHIDGRLLN